MPTGAFSGAGREISPSQRTGKGRVRGDAVPDGRAEEGGGDSRMTRRRPDMLPGVAEVVRGRKEVSTVGLASGTVRSKSGEDVGSKIWIVVVVACHANQLV